ncbi:hypothetical protein EVAR_15896_1 [Eumeta japonica]|uniref:Uncharacterized protein n=1 Tax=Eumeta variegata TaxID=151549 RepID=A0A4C1UEY4_EUMVA|nr:hypothetical protein EVAR_15896_1 [Eumeta japonica]
MIANMRTKFESAPRTGDKLRAAAAGRRGRGAIRPTFSGPPLLSAKIICWKRRSGRTAIRLRRRRAGGARAADARGGRAPPAELRNNPDGPADDKSRRCRCRSRISAISFSCAVLSLERKLKNCELTASSGNLCLLETFSEGSFKELKVKASVGQKKLKLSNDDAIVKGVGPYDYNSQKSLVLEDITPVYIRRSHLIDALVFSVHRSNVAHTIPTNEINKNRMVRGRSYEAVSKVQYTSSPQLVFWRYAVRRYHRDGEF